MKKTLCLLLALLLLAAGCAPAPAASGASGAGPAAVPLRQVDVVLDWYPNALHAFLYTAQQNGYFAEEGLAVNLRFPSNANDALSLVAAGKAQVGLYYQQDVILARANQDVPVKSIGAVVQYPLNVLLSLKEKNITSPADLEGKRVGYASTELSLSVVESMMRQVGADFSTVEMVDVGFDLMSSMTTGNVDATVGCLLNHEVPQMEKEGFAVNAVPLDAFGVPTYYEGIFVANDSLVQSDPALLQGFLRACARGFADMRDDPEQALQILLQNQNAENFPLDEDVERQSTAILLPLMETADAPFLSQSAALWQQNIDWLDAQGLLTRKPAVEELVAALPA